MKYFVNEDVKTCDIEFDLLKGSYATSCLREIMEDKLIVEDSDEYESGDE